MIFIFGLIILNKVDIISATNVHLNLKLKLQQLKKPKKGNTLIGV